MDLIDKLISIALLALTCCAIAITIVGILVIIGVI